MNGPSKKIAGTIYARQALLPEGFRDQLAPAAEQEALIVRSLVDSFHSHGYDSVSPPTVEYEDSLLVGAGAARGPQMFRVMDPDTQRMMAVRTDMTVQTARLAATRLADAPRPLRLAYSGNVLRTKGSQIRPARQFVQAGVELVGCDSLDAELEVIAVAVEGLQNVGIEGVSVDLTTAPLARALCEEFGFDETATNHILEALDAKDVGALESLPSDAKNIFGQLLASAGTADRAVDLMQAIGLSGAAGELVDRVATLVAMLATRLPDLSLTVDPCETHGFEYKTGIGFALFAKGGKGELGRGGRYNVVYPDGHAEEAVGFSVYLDSLMAVLPLADLPKKLYLPYGTKLEVAANLRNEGWRTIQGLTEGGESLKEAARLGCSHIYSEGAVSAL
ncbi:MAG: ATP phosphoribosyltransferase regulatory subunit [Kordiimonadaceae bacterium]|nr:ATP phosphoribosyltransferase regulatory subunit [Kordiimonadaceae bacterium]